MSGKLLLPQNGYETPEVELQPTELNLTDTCLIQFWAFRDKLPPLPPTIDGLRIQPTVTRFHSRIDTDRAGVVVGQVCVDQKPAFHAGICAFATMLKLYHQGIKKVEGSQQQVFDPRSVMRGFAVSYGCVINDVASIYSHVLPWLYHPRLQHPKTLDALVNGIIKQQEGKVQLEL